MNTIINGKDYHQAIEWIAKNDHLQEQWALDEEAVATMSTVLLVSAIAHKDSHEVARDIVEYRIRYQLWGKI